jgi:senataxin
MADAAKEKRELEAQLKDLHDLPVGSEGDQKTLLARPFDFLVKVEPSTSDGLLHWFCDKALDPLVVEAATFLLRLHAYNSPKVKIWRDKLAQVIRGCAGCTKSLQDLKLSSRTTCVLEFFFLFIYFIY